jgi:hypothetical protein
MRGDFRRYWDDPDYWRWLWRELSGEDRAAIVGLFAIGLGLAGFLGGQRLAASQEAGAFTTRSIVTVVRKVRAEVPREVAKPRTTMQAGETEVVTVRRNGRPVVVRRAAETVTVRAPARERFVTDEGIGTVRTQTRERFTTVTEPGATVTEPGATVTTPGTTVTTPGKTEIVARDVTLPPVTVVETNVVTVTQEVTVTSETTVTVTETDKKKPKP